MAKKKPDRLALEVNAALAAGMSYGKWKAAIYERQQNAPKHYIPDYADDDGDAICQMCGQPFLMGDAYGDDRLYCPNCLPIHRLEIAPPEQEATPKTGKRTHEIVCADCGNTFLGKYAKYCPDCVHIRRARNIVGHRSWEVAQKPKEEPAHGIYDKYITIEDTYRFTPKVRKEST